MEVEIEFKEPVAWIKDLVETHSASIRIRDIRMSGEGVKDLLEIFMPSGKIEGFSSELLDKMLGIFVRIGFQFIQDLVKLPGNFPVFLDHPVKVVFKSC